MIVPLYDPLLVETAALWAFVLFFYINEAVREWAK